MSRADGAWARRCGLSKAAIGPGPDCRPRAAGLNRHMECWSCGAEIPLRSGQKVNTRDVCPHCDADLHVCKNCRHFDTAAHNDCREVMAEWVRYKDRWNYCDYFTLAGTGPVPKPAGAEADADAARRKFDRLFGS